MTVERRYQPLSECRADSTGAIVGLAAVFYDGTPATEYRLMTNAVERIMPGAFDACINHDVRALFNHSVDNVLGRTTSGTLTLTITSRGLEYSIKAGNTQLHRDLAEQIARGDISGSSFAFVVGKDRWTRQDKQDVREIVLIETLVDVGPVAFPAYAGTTAGVRSDNDVSEEVKRAWRKHATERFARAVRARWIEIDSQQR